MTVLEPVLEPVAARADDALPDDIGPAEPLIELPACAPGAVKELREALGVDSLIAQTLARRGLDTPDLARVFLEPTELHDPADLPGATQSAAVIAGQLRAGGRIAVHGDYDVDGVSSTAIMVRTLTRLGADVTWHVPSRFEEGYGLSRQAIERLARDGADLLVAVDCGITAVDEVAFAREQGMEVVICDHHRHGETLPNAAIAHPALGEYACPELCAAAVVHKVCTLVVRETGGDETAMDEELELVGLATVCDVVPLRGENRELARRGVEKMRQTLRPGLRELMPIAGVDQLKLDATSFGFRLGPRINAAGRMFSAEPAVELLLTSSSARAAELAAELSAANSRRQEIEQSILFQAETQARRQRDQYAIVVAGEDWHGGVLGIVAGRIAERFRRPCVALALEGGVAKGSGRSGGVYDLHAGLAACGELLTRFGGHKAAAGLELDEARLPAFRTAFQNHAREHLTADDLRPRVRVDAIADPSQLTIEAAEQLARLGPFGASNREPSLLVPDVSVTALRRMGESGKHLKLSIAARGGRHAVVAFSWDGPEIAHGEDSPPADLVVRLSKNEWRGVVEPQSRLVSFATCGERQAGSWAERFESSLESSPPERSPGPSLDIASTTDRRGESPLAVVAELLAVDPGAILVLADDPSQWAEPLAALARAARVPAPDCIAFGGAVPEGDLSRLHLVLVEPPYAPSLVPSGACGVTLAWNLQIARIAAARAAEVLISRRHVTDAYRAVREQPQRAETSFEGLRKALPNPVAAGRAIRVLEELGLVTLIRNAGPVDSIEVANASKTELDRSPTFRSYSELREESTRWLANLTGEN